MSVIKYVVGFMFDPNMNKVVMIRKKSPPEMYGLLNGVGGKIEEGEAPINAMIREFKEETGVYYEKWLHFGEIDVVNKALVHCYTAISPKYAQVKSRTAEPVIVTSVKTLHVYPQISNIATLVSAALEALKSKEKFPGQSNKVFTKIIYN